MTALPRWTAKQCASCGATFHVRIDETFTLCIACDAGPSNEQETETMNKKKKTNGAAHHPEPKRGTDHAKLLAEGGEEKGRYTDRLKVPVKADELAVAATEFAHLFRERERVLDERREAMAGFRETLTGIDEKMKPLAETVENGTRLADIECVDILMPDNSVRVVRLDTGEATGEVKQATAEDLQPELFEDYEPAAPERTTDPAPPEPAEGSETGALALEQGADA